MTQAREHHLPEMPTTGSDWRPMPPRIFEQQFAEQFEQALAKVIADMRFLHNVPGAKVTPDELSLRDHFAAAALAHPYTHDEHANGDCSSSAAWAYDLADAMLAQRAK